MRAILMKKTVEMKTVIAVRHVPFEDLGSFAHPLANHGFQVKYREAGLDDLSEIDALQPELMIVLGGPISANDEVDYPFLGNEMRLIETRLRSDRPTIGVCLGSQLMARALGVQVYPGLKKEIGWSPLTLTDVGQRTCLRHLSPDTTSVLHWHGDTFDLPAGAVCLASTPDCKNQAFSWGKNALALQFHLEATCKGLERWFIGHTHEITATPGVTVAHLRADTARWGPTLETQGRRCIEEWLLRLCP